VHALSTANSASAAIKTSEAELQLMLEVFDFLSGVKLPIGGITAECLDAPTDTVTATVGRVRHSVDAFLVKFVDAPAEEKLTKTDPRLVVWLRLANDARDATTDANGLRSYQLILEDMNISPLHLKYARNFVSHSERCLTDSKLRKFLEGELCKVLTTFDPGDAAHREFARKWRDEGRKAVEGELTKLL
jgi:hypothetical protein